MDKGNKQRGCIKCGHTEAEISEIATTGTGLSKLFDYSAQPLSNRIM